MKKSKEEENSKERLLPKNYYTDAYYDHLSRYIFASGFCKDKIVGDIACGTGYGSDYITKNGNAKKVYGVDISAEAIKIAKKTFKDKKIDFICSDATKLPFKDNFFDVIVSFETIEHIGNYEKYLKEIKRILKPEGAYIVSTPNKKFSSPFSIKPRNPFHTIEWTPKKFEMLLGKYFSSLEAFYQVEIKNPKTKLIKVFTFQLISSKGLEKVFSFPINFYRKLKKLNKEPMRSEEEYLKRYRVKKSTPEGGNPLIMVYVCRNQEIR